MVLNKNRFLGDSLLDALPALNLADHFDFSSMRPKSLPHLLDVLGRAYEAGEHHVHPLGHPEPQVGLVPLADRRQADQVAAGEVDSFATAEQPAGLHHRVHPVRPCNHGPVKEK